MLESLKISNYALIDSLDITFGSGLTIITGETGAGKSIMLGALGLLLGGRADTHALRDNNKKCVVEAVFSNPDEKLRPFVEQADADWDSNSLILRREISANGRSRSFINDSPASLKALSPIGIHLIDIHSQHCNMLLTDERMQTEIIDALASNTEQAEAYRRAYRQYVGVANKLKALETELAANRENEEFLRFRLEQLDALKPRRGELPELEKEYELLSDADALKQQLSAASGMISGEEKSALESLYGAKSILAKINLSLYGEDAPDIIRRLESLYIDLKDIGEALDRFTSGTEANPARLERLEERISKIYDAKRRFKVNNADELVAIHEELSKSLSDLKNADQTTDELKTELKQAGHKLKECAETLSETRRKAAVKFEKDLEELAKPLGLPNLKFKVSVSKSRLGPDGGDEVEFLCAFNKSQELMPVAAVASGGEISRLMLSVKAIVARCMNLPTIIFDEIDTGVSGDIADRMGALMVELSQWLQVITITHLPQVAAKGKSHFKVFKNDRDEQTFTEIKQLTEKEREIEIARMLSGAEIGEAALLNARALLGIENKI